MNGLVRFILAIVLVITSLCFNNTPAIADTKANATTAISEIHQVLDRYIEGWEKSDPTILKSLWDWEYPEATYLPVESTEIIKGTENIGKYYDLTAPSFPILGANLKNIATDVFGDYAHVACNTDFVVKTNDGSQVILHPRLSFTLEYKNNQWLVIHYAESATIQS